MNCGDASIQKAVSGINGHIFQVELHIHHQIAMPHIADETRITHLQLLQTAKEEIGFYRLRDASPCCMRVWHLNSLKRGNSKGVQPCLKR